MGRRCAPFGDSVRFLSAGAALIELQRRKPALRRRRVGDVMIRCRPSSAQNLWRPRSRRQPGRRSSGSFATIACAIGRRQAGASTDHAMDARRAARTSRPPTHRPGARASGPRYRASFASIDQRADHRGTRWVSATAQVARRPNGLSPPGGSTTTVVPCFTRSNRSMTSSLVMRMQPDEIAWPIYSGWLVPWMRYSVSLPPS